MTAPQTETQQTGRGAVLFDIDGTLIDSTYHHALAWQRAFDRHQVSVPLWRIHRTVGMGGDKLVTEVAGEDVEERIGDDLRDAWGEEYAELEAEVRPLPGAAELVRKAAGDGYLVALASSGEKKFAEHVVELLDLGDTIATLTTADDAEDSKPDPDLLHITAERIGATRAVLVGDTPYDVESAARAGLRCIGLRSGGYSQAELEEAGAALVVDAPEDLMDVDWEDYLSTVE